MSSYIFHAACTNCTQQIQQASGADYCAGCQYFQADWTLSSLRDNTLSEADVKRLEIKKRLNV